MRPTDLGTLTLLDLARAEEGVAEVKGKAHNPRIVGWLQRVGKWADKDEVPWCSAFVDEIAHRAGCCASHSLRARSWLKVGESVEFMAGLERVRSGMDIVILNRGGPADPTVIDAPGHVGFYTEYSQTMVCLFGGNQGDRVCHAWYPRKDILGIRRLHRI